MITQFRKLIGRIIGEINMDIPIEHYYHEMGHSLFCLIFSDSFIYKRMHFDKETLMRVGDDAWGGAIHIQGIVEKKFESPSAYYIKLIIIAFAGGCAENYLSYDYSSIDKYVGNWIESPSRHMDTKRMSGDLELIIKPSAKRFLTDDHYPEFRKNVFRFIFNILHDEKVCTILSFLSHDLHSRQNEIEEGSVIISLFNKSGLSEYVEECIAKIMEDFHASFDKYKSFDNFMKIILYSEA